jgi:hypothetical protein
VSRSRNQAVPGGRLVLQHVRALTTCMCRLVCGSDAHVRRLMPACVSRNGSYSDAIRTEYMRLHVSKRLLRNLLLIKTATMLRFCRQRTAHVQQDCRRWDFLWHSNPNYRKTRIIWSTSFCTQWTPRVVRILVSLLQNPCQMYINTQKTAFNVISASVSVIALFGPKQKLIFQISCIFWLWLSVRKRYLELF